MDDINSNVDSIKSSVKAFFKKVFEDIAITLPEEGIGHLKGKPTIYVSTHRSHLDYFIIGHVLEEIGLRNIRYAAGDNLTNLPVIGKKFKKLGAFTVHRSKATHRNYVRELCRDAVEILKKGESIVVFPEGGRSYSGEMKNLKGGLITAGFMAQTMDPENDYFLAPISITYEKLPELKFLNLIQKGKNIRSGTRNPFKKLYGNLLYFGGDITAFLVLFFASKRSKKYGKVYINFGKPLNIKEIQKQCNHYDPDARDEFSAHRVTVKKVNSMIYDKFTNLMKVTPVNVVAKVLSDKSPLEINKAEELLPEMLNKLPADTKCDTSVLHRRDPAEVFDTGLRHLISSGAAVKRGGCIRIKRRGLINYYVSVFN
ncbi:MAG: 1-acyl-sn-glycerol-3-phosphate acyltransferase [Chitinivibrionales bacterium]